MSGSSPLTFDPTIPLQAGKGVQQPNPLQQIGQFAQVQNALNNLKLFPGQLQQQQQAIQTNQTNLMNLNNASAYRALAPLLAGGPITHDSLTTALGSAEKNLGLSTHQVLQDVLATAPSGDGPDFDARMRALIASRSQTSPESAVGMVTPHSATIDTGPAIQPVNIAPAGAAQPGAVIPIGAAFGKTLSPSEATTPTQIGVDAQGRPIYGTRGQFVEKAADASPLGTGRFPAALAGPNAPQQPQGIPMGVGPAQQSQMQTQGAASAQAFQNIANEGVQARGQNAVLGNMLTDIGQFPTGQPMLNSWKALSVKYAPTIAAAFGLPADQVAANESFDKLANQIAGAQGERSDARLSVAQAANPGSHLSPAGADLIIRQLQGNADYIQARAQLASKFPDQTDRAGFESKVGSNLDPRAFQFARMTPQQKLDYVKNLSGTDKKALQSSYNWSSQNGLINAGG